MLLTNLLKEIDDSSSNSHYSLSLPAGSSMLSESDQPFQIVNTSHKGMSVQYAANGSYSPPFSSPVQNLNELMSQNMAKV